MVIAVDFDGCLCSCAFPEIGEQLELHKNVADYIRSQKKDGATIILWTCREDLAERKYLSEALQWCEEHDIPIDYANEYPTPGFGGRIGRKVCADIYIDDKAVNVDCFGGLR